MLNKRREFNYEEDWRGIENLVRKARQQAPEGLPFVICIDVNLPPSPYVMFEQKPWLRDVRRVLQRVGAPTEEQSVYRPQICSFKIQKN